MTLQTILDPERAASSIRVISLSPGPTETPMGAKMNQACPARGPDTERDPCGSLYEEISC